MWSFLHSELSKILSRSEFDSTDLSRFWDCLSVVRTVTFQSDLRLGFKLHVKQVRKTTRRNGSESSTGDDTFHWRKQIELQEQHACWICKKLRLTKNYEWKACPLQKKRRKGTVWKTFLELEAVLHVLTFEEVFLTCLSETKICIDDSATLCTEKHLWSMNTCPAVRLTQ